MADEDLTKLSVEELLARAKAQPAVDLSKLSNEELIARAKAAKPTTPTGPLEFPDAPTTARLPLPGIDMSFLPEGVRKAMGLSGKEGLSVGGKAATLFGPTLTDNPVARAQILAKHLPGAMVTADKNGHPMIEYQGKKYYTSRPGEFDANDAGRLATGVTATFPALAVAPASIPLAMAVGGAVNMGQSVGEDILTNVAGGTAQPVDPMKAAIAGGVGVAMPPIVNQGIKLAGNLYSRFAPSLLDAAGNVTDAARRMLTSRTGARVDPDILTPDQLRLLDQAARENFGSPQAVRSAHNQALGQEFSVPQTRGQLTRDPTQTGLEDSLRSGGRGPVAMNTMTVFGEGQTEALSEAQRMVRGRISGQGPLTAQEAGDVLASGFNQANRNAAQEVSAIYNASSDAATQATHGIPSEVPLPFIGSMAGTVDAALQRSGPGQVILNRNFEGLAPQAAAARNLIQDWARDPRSLGPPGSVGINWEGVDKLRRQLLPHQTNAYGSRNATDIAAMNRVMAGFDEHFAGLNPLLEQAREAASQRFATFGAGRGKTAATNQVLKTLNLIDGEGNPIAPGPEVINKIFGSMNRGEAEPVIRHLQQVYADNPVALNTLKDQALRRLFTDADGVVLSPQRARTAIQKAFGERQGSAYEALFTRDEQNQLRRYLALNTNIAEALKQVNPSGSGHLWGALARAMRKETIGATLGSSLGGLIGGPGGALAGGMAGGAVGHAVEGVASQVAATRAVNPPASLRPNFSTPAYRLGQGLDEPLRGLLDY